MNDWTLRRVDALDVTQVEQLAGILMECVPEFALAPAAAPRW